MHRSTLIASIPGPSILTMHRSCRQKLNYEPVCEKLNNLGSDQVRHKSGCTVTEDG